MRDERREFRLQEIISCVGEIYIFKGILFVLKVAAVVPILEDTGNFSMYMRLQVSVYP